MKKLLPLLLTIPGCSQYAADLSISYRQDWTANAVYQAAEFWMAHDVRIRVQPSNPFADLVVWTMDLDDHIAECDCSHGRGVINLDPRLEEGATTRYTSCTIAHEIGHALGMDHVDEPRSLLYYVMLDPAENDDVCAWSDEDQAEFDRATGG